MTDDINVTLRGHKLKEDSEKLKRILNDMENYKITAKDKEEGFRKAKDEIRRRLIEAGLSK